MITSATLRLPRPQSGRSTKSAPIYADLEPRRCVFTNRGNADIEDDATFALTPKFNISVLDSLDSSSTADDLLVFRNLVMRWHNERGATSSITKMAMCSSYQRIIAMGEKAVPLILRQLENERDQPDMWFWALQSLTGVDPVPDHARGDMVAMAQAWFNWARGKYAW